MNSLGESIRRPL